MIELGDAIPVLKDLKNNNKLMLFVGSGISVPPPSNLPTWEGFLDAFIDFCRNIDSRYQHHISTPLFTPELFTDANNEKSKYPGVVASVLKNKLTELPDRIRTNVMNEYKAWFTNFFGYKEPNDYHKSIIEADYKYILTSNYDTLLEEAAIRAGKIYSSVSFFESTNLAETIYTETPAIIHVHGKYPDIAIEKTIITSDDYFKIIKKQYPAFTFTMHSLLMRYSTLFMGYGASDPHLEDLLEEFAAYISYDHGAVLPKNFLVLPRAKASRIKDEYKKRIGTELIVIDDYSDYKTLLDSLVP